KRRTPARRPPAGTPFSAPSSSFSDSKHKNRSLTPPPNPLSASGRGRNTGHAPPPLRGEWGESRLSLPLLGGQRDADDLLVVAGEQAAVRECRMRPEDGATETAEARPAGRLEQMSPVNFLVSLGRHSRDDQVALFVEQEIAIALRDDEGVLPAIFGFLAATRRGHFL